ncbi:hypothetical protein T492DRAFT_888014 [Pavlovales sp. CCMP2436]|nr:hypothetical protein T492DRAFT_888014 [Pavlovales sp. CCMP2436]
MADSQRTLAIKRRRKLSWLGQLGGTVCLAIVTGMLARCIRRYCGDGGGAV